MPRKSKRSNKKNSKRSRTMKQKIYVMRGCSKKTKSCKNKKVFSTLGNKGCPNCGPNCHCGPSCNCPHPCPGTCYLNRRQKGGAGCGSCGCPIAPLSTKQMNMFGGDNYLPNNISPGTVQLDYKPIIGIGQNGGSCSSCGQIPMTQSGGNFFKPASSMPGPMVGSSWGAALGKWPGINGISSGRNFLKSYDTDNNIVSKDPQLQMITGDSGYSGSRYLNGITGGGRRKSGRSKSKSRSKSRSKSKSVRGGGLIPQDLVNLGNDFSFNLKSAYNSLNGYKAPVDPLPYKDQLTHSLNNNRLLL